MRGCDNSKIQISSNFILSICLLIMFITLQHLATLNHSTPNYNSLHLSTLHFLSFTLHYSPIWLNPSSFPIGLFHLTSLNYTLYGSHIPKLISKVMNPFTALRNFSTFHFFFIWFFLTFLINPPLHFTLLFASTNHFPSLFTFYRLHFPHCFTLSYPSFWKYEFYRGKSLSPFQVVGSSQ
jgi:hypothetical protein